MPRKKKTQEDKEKRGVRGEGSVYQRKSDGRWVASVSLGDGKKKHEYFDTEKEAYQARRRMLLELEQRKLVEGFSLLYHVWRLYRTNVPLTGF